jgi:hypothetical protein
VGDAGGANGAGYRKKGRNLNQFFCRTKNKKMDTGRGVVNNKTDTIHEF